MLIKARTASFINGFKNDQSYGLIDEETIFQKLIKNSWAKFKRNTFLISVFIYRLKAKGEVFIQL